jgi:hypothetical protein
MGSDTSVKGICGETFLAVNVKSYDEKIHSPYGSRLFGRNLPYFLRL